MAVNIVTFRFGMVPTSILRCTDTLFILPHTNKITHASFIA